MTLPLLVFIGSPYLEAQQGNYYTLAFPTPEWTHKNSNIHIPTDNKTLENKNNQENALSLAVVQLFSQLYLMAYHSIILKP